ncbi:MAG: hypothetical protein ACI9TH_005182, partial [Kiritimatiellia bacterium]
AGLPSPANGTLIIPRPVLQLHPLGPTSRMIAWDAFPGLSYTVEYKDQLQDPSWTLLGTVTTNHYMDVSAPDTDQRVYRVRRQN